MNKLSKYGWIILTSALYAGCATPVSESLSGETRDESAVVIGEGHGIGRFLLDVVPGASRIVGDKAPGMVNSLIIRKVNGHPVSPSAGDEYWLIEGSYTFLISCGFKDFSGKVRSLDSTTDVTLVKGKEYEIEGDLKVIGRDFWGGATYQCNTRIAEKVW